MSSSGDLLGGLRVLELGTAIAAPLCTMLLGEMGAEVIKVEQPGKGDDARYWGTLVKGESLYFLHYNKNKKSIAVNLKSDKGREIFLKLVENADVVVENYRPGVLERLGLSYDILSARNKGVILCSISGFGQTGPYSGLGGYDVIVQAMSGIMSVTGEPDGEPMRVGFPVADILASLYSTYSIIAALYRREKTGEGEWIDISLYDAAVSAMGQWLSIYLGSGRLPERFGNKYPLIAPYEPFKARDGYIMLAVANEEQWRRFCSAAGLENLLSDPRFRTNQDRIKTENRRALEEIVSATISRKTVKEWLEIFWEAGIPSGPVNSVDALLDDAQLKVRNMFQSVEHPKLGRLGVVGAVPKMLKSVVKVRGPPPLLGQHTVEILKWLGYSDNEIRSLESDGVISCQEKIY
ncbi:MAG: CoA transferase [Nitrososphaerota archaeon]